jgi:hypothetical protein
VVQRWLGGVFGGLMAGFAASALAGWRYILPETCHFIFSFFPSTYCGQVGLPSSVDGIKGDTMMVEVKPSTTL